MADDGPEVETAEGGISKNAIKKQLKAEEAAKKKAEKDAEKGIPLNYHNNFIH